MLNGLIAQAGKLNVFDVGDFRNMWRNTPDNPNNFKLSLQPASLYDQFGNFAYGATAEVVGYPLWFTQWAGAYGRNGSLTGNNLPINKQISPAATTRREAEQHTQSHQLGFKPGGSHEKVDLFHYDYCNVRYFSGCGNRLPSGTELRNVYASINRCSIARLQC